MALIEVFHVVATQMPIDANNATDIPQGRLVTLDANGQVQLALGGEIAPTAVAAQPLGIAGDSRSRGTSSFTPESGSATGDRPSDPLSDTILPGALVLGAYGDQVRSTQNRVADNFNEVLASGKMTIYSGGGEFWTDQYEILEDDGSTVITYLPGAEVYTARTDNNGTAGRFSDEFVAAATSPVGHTLNAPSEFPSGVPGTGPNAVGFQALPEGGNSLSFGQFLHVLMVI